MSLLKTKYVPNTTGLFAVFDAGHNEYIKNKADGLTSGVGNCVDNRTTANLGSMKFTTSPISENCNTKFMRARNIRRTGGGNFFTEENEHEATVNKAKSKPDVSSLTQKDSDLGKTRISTSDINCKLKEAEEGITNTKMEDDIKDITETEREIIKLKVENDEKDKELEKFRGYIIQPCTKHSKYNLDLYCCKCGSFICVVCKLLNHVKHDFVDLSLLPKDCLSSDLKPLNEVKVDYKGCEKTVTSIHKDFAILKSGIFYKSQQFDEKSRRSKRSSCFFV